MFKQIFFSYIQRLKRDDLSTYSAQIAFFSMLSLVPLMLFLSGLLNLQGLVDLIIEAAHLNDQTAQILQSLISGVDGSFSLFSFSTITIVWASSRMIRAIMKGIHMAYREQDNHSFIIRYLISFLYTLLLCLVLFLAFTGFMYGHSILQIMASLGLETTLFDILWNIGRFILPAGFGFLVFWTMYRLIPTRKVTLRDCLPGAVLSTVLVFLFSFIFSLMVKLTGNFSLLYGSLSNVIMILMWFLFFGYALLLGMELNGVLYEDADYQLFVTELRAKMKENAAIRKEKNKEKRALRKQERLEKKEEKARFREAAKVLAAQMAEEDAKKKAEEAENTVENTDAVEVSETVESTDIVDSVETIDHADTDETESAETTETSVMKEEPAADENTVKTDRTENAEKEENADSSPEQAAEKADTSEATEPAGMSVTPEPAGTAEANESTEETGSTGTAESAETTETTDSAVSTEPAAESTTEPAEIKESETSAPSSSENTGRGRGRRRNRKRH